MSINALTNAAAARRPDFAPFGTVPRGLAGIAFAAGNMPEPPRSWPIWEMAAGTVAYAAWATALPTNPFPDYPPSLAGIAVLVASTVLGMLAPLFQRKLGT